MKYRHIVILTFTYYCMFLCVSCSKDIDAPSLPSPVGVEVAAGTTLAADQLFGIWEGTTEVGTTNANHFEQSYRIEFQSVDDGTALFSHWYVDAATTTRDSVCNVEYTYLFDGSTIEFMATRRHAGAAAIKAVHTGNNQMELYTTNEGLTTRICTLERTRGPEPAVTGVDHTLPQAGQTVTITGRNLQFVDRLFLPTASGETEVTDFTATSKQIVFTLPQTNLAPGYIRCQATDSKVSTYTPAMFCRNCVFFHDFSTHGTAAPYTGTEFENTINITQSLFDKITVVSSDNLPEGHCLSVLRSQLSTMVCPDVMLCFFGNTPTAWPEDTSLDPSTGMLRFSFGDRMQYVIDHSDGLITATSKCKEVAVEMDIYVFSNGHPVWDTGFMSFRLDKDQSKSLTQSWFAQTAAWSYEAPVSFADGWKTFTIPLSAFAVTESDLYATVGSLATYLRANKKQSVIKLLNYQLDATHAAQALDTFQFCIADMRLVPYGIPKNTALE